MQIMLILLNITLCPSCICIVDAVTVTHIKYFSWARNLLRDK
jgi:hypothetical protein